MPAIFINEADDVVLVEIILNYLAGRPNSLIKGELADQCTRGISCKQRYEQIVPRTMTQIMKYDDCVQSILDALSVPEEKQASYKKSPNLYALLKKLEPKYRHLTYLIDLIDETKPTTSWAKPFLFTALATAGSAILLSFKKKYVAELSLLAKKATVHFLYGLQRTLRLVKNTPLLGILINGVALLWAWYQAFSDGLWLDHDKGSTLFLKTVENTFPIIGYLLCFFAAGVMTTPALSLFIIGSAIDAIGGLYSFVRHEIEQRLEPVPEGVTYPLETARARVAILRKRDLSMLLVNLVATGLITASVVVWCLFPPSWIITASCVAFGWLVGMFKLLSTAHLKQTYADSMQQNLKHLTEAFSSQANEHRQSPIVESSHASIIGQLEQEVEVLKQRVTRLEQPLPHLTEPLPRLHINLFITVERENSIAEGIPIISSLSVNA